MKVPIQIRCTQCGRQQDVFIRLDDSKIESSCVCGQDLFAILAGFTIGYKLLQRSRYEYLHNSDYSLSIVFAATAMDCELSRLYVKWKKIDSVDPYAWPKDDEIEETLRKFRNIAAKIDAVAQLMYPAGLCAFVSGEPDLTNTIRDGFTRLDLKNLSSSFQKVLFWPRNRILHLGGTKVNSEDAKYCFNTAFLGIRLLEQLDKHRIAAT